MSGSKKLEYDVASKTKFETYFTKPKKRGRPPPKKRRGRPKKKVAVVQQRQSMMEQDSADQDGEEGGQPVIDLTGKQMDELDARLEGTVAKCRRTTAERINWDSPDYSILRDIIAKSWDKKNNLYSQGESFGRFCKRMGINRNVLQRYLEGKYKHPELRAKRRGRPSLLTESVMRHLCEGVCAIIYN